MEYRELLEIAKGAVSVARDAVLAELRKGATEAELDLAADRAILSYLQREVGDATVVTEESGIVELGTGGPLVFVVDPLDGTTNAARRYPCFASSVCVAEGPRLSDAVAGAVINVASGDLFEAAKGFGTRLNGEKVAPSATKKIEDAVVALDLNVRKRIPGFAAAIADIIESANHVRFLGTDALEISLVSCGSCDIFADLRGYLRATDFAAAAFIVREAGGVVADATGKDLDVELRHDARSSIIASCTRDLLNDLLSRFRPLK